jgi:hypothetical protein
MEATSVALCNRRRPVDFRSAPLATEDEWRCNISRRARSGHSITSSAQGARVHSGTAVSWRIGKHVDVRQMPLRIADNCAREPNE